MKSYQIESVLEEEQVEYEYKNIYLAEINVPESLKNQARLGEDVVDSYVLSIRKAMESGTEFLAIVARGTQKGYVVMDGNHRVAAAMGIDGVTVIDAYVASPRDQREVDILTRSLNARLLGALGAPIEDSVEHAKFLMVCYPEMKVAEASLTMGVSVNVINKSIRDDEVRVRLARLGVPEGLNLSVKRGLGRIKNDNVLRKAGKMAFQAGLKSDDAEEIARQIEDRSTEATKLKVVEEWANRPGIARKIQGKKARKVAPARKVLFRAVSALTRELKKEVSSSELEITNDGDLDTLKELIALLNGLVRKAKKAMEEVK